MEAEPALFSVLRHKTARLENPSEWPSQDGWIVVGSVVFEKKIMRKYYFSLNIWHRKKETEQLLLQLPPTIKTSLNLPAFLIRCSLYDNVIIQKSYICLS